MIKAILKDQKTICPSWLCNSSRDTSDATVSEDVLKLHRRLETSLAAHIAIRTDSPTTQGKHPDQSQLCRRHSSGTVTTN